MAADPCSLRSRQCGAALLMAMLTVALVATMAAAALWQQWRSVEIEARERERLQATWILIGALDWARLILREDARSAGPDHLAEPWSIALREARLSTFLAIERGGSELGDDAFLSGQITDAQARLNITNLIVGNQISEPDREAFARLFTQLGIPTTELDDLAANLLRATGSGDKADDSQAPIPLLAQRVAQLAWLGVSARSLALLQPYIVVLPTRTQLNLNTASAEAIAARIEGLDLSDARNLVNARNRAPFRTLSEISRIVPAAERLDPSQVGVATRFFEVEGRLRLHDTEVRERSLVQRNGLGVTTVWRERTAADVTVPQAATR
ncbi:MAG TPA: type II secretion system minor pseudopilin GspK [Burkholderiaceae bacterium]|nr:type II secretion system minor pseudopilin GspK [Rhodoferax sp.]HQX60363.1 type II secretion system minor pseudopilin GspK [Burkholderiaceae bacterium]HQZ06119.1 type II secretion system minor pseudopilin GspK [Burkholderiaceae bacterium]HRA61405.1 type II secretion system minor pseudopilin GspK [Burkholderiaceae bacterium]